MTLHPTNQLLNRARVSLLKVTVLIVSGVAGLTLAYFADTADDRAPLPASAAVQVSALDEGM